MIMDKTELAAFVSRELIGLYPESSCALDYRNEPWKLLVMGRLSAQCTDKRVNIVCETLFSEFPTAKALGEGDLCRIEEIVRPCGLYRTKAASIKEACRMLTEEYGGVLPDKMEDLLRFPGVGRKIANLLLGDIYGLPAIVADTHCIRVSARVGLTPQGEKDPYRTEMILREHLPPEGSSDFCHRIVQFGRDICDARKPKCEVCPLIAVCQYYESVRKEG